MYMEINSRILGVGSSHFTNSIADSNSSTELDFVTTRVYSDTRGCSARSSRSFLSVWLYHGRVPTLALLDGTYLAL